METNLVTLAIIIAVVSGAGGIVSVTMPFILQLKTNNIYKNIKWVLFSVGMLIYISFLFIMHPLYPFKTDCVTTYKEYPIQYLTTNYIYFNNNDGHAIDKDYVIIEEPNAKHNNVVIVETLNYKVQWLFKLPLTAERYHVYLSEDNYNFLANNNKYKHKLSKE